MGRRVIAVAALGAFVRVIGHNIVTLDRGGEDLCDFHESDSFDELLITEQSVIYSFAERVTHVNAVIYLSFGNVVPSP